MHKAKTLPALSGLRGLAALVVFVSHSANQGLAPDALGRGFGQLGVMLFFLLSGFLMGYLYLGRPMTRESVYRFTESRIARVVPLYLACVALSVIISNGIDPNFHYDFGNITLAVRAALFIDAPYEFWTIPVEMQFYVAFVALWWLWRHAAHFGWLILFIGLFAALALAQSLWTQIDAQMFPRYSPAFFAGVATAMTLSWWREQAGRRWLAVFSWLAFPLFALNLPGLRQDLGLTFSEDFFWRTWGDPINWIIVYGAFICAVLNLKSARFLNHRAFAYLGSISFAFYLFHYPIIKYSKLLPVGAVTQFCAAFGLTLLLAHLSLRYFEKPVSDWVKQRRSNQGVDHHSAASPSRLILFSQTSLRRLF